MAAKLDEIDASLNLIARELAGPKICRRRTPQPLDQAATF
jgi:hypothetical protein